MKGKAKSVFIKLVSTLGTGYFYSSKKSVKNNSRKLLLKKYDPIMRMHALFKVCNILNLICNMFKHRADDAPQLSRTTQHDNTARNTAHAPRHTPRATHHAPCSTTTHLAPHNTTAPRTHIAHNCSGWEKS
jgi:large subunit ribosomal protein L33